MQTLTHQNDETMHFSSNRKRLKLLKFYVVLVEYCAFFRLNIMSYVTDYEFNEMLCLLNDFKQIQEINELDSCNKTRLRMFIYCHIIEVDLVYMILYNLLRTIRREKYSPIIKYKKNNGHFIDAKYPVQKIEQIENDSQAVGIPLKPIYSEFYFSHSQYFLEQNGALNLSKNLMSSSSAVQKEPTKQSFYEPAEIKSIFSKSLLYVKAFTENHKVFLKEYEDGGLLIRERKTGSRR